MLITSAQTKVRYKKNRYLTIKIIIISRNIYISHMAFCVKHNSPLCRIWRQKTDRDGRPPFKFWRWFFGACLRQEIIALVHSASRIFLYIYLGAVVLAFFFQNNLPRLFLELTESFGGIYMGVLGIYFVAKEILRRAGKPIPQTAGEAFFIIWIVLLILSTGLTWFSPDFHFGKIYTLILKNSFAAVIFRIGMFLK